MLVSPAEPERLRTVGTVSSLPERYGADFLFAAHGRWVAIQRKEISDLLASVADGRIAKEVAQIQLAHHRILIVEGMVRWSSDGVLIGKGFGQQWTKKQFRGLLWSVRAKGIWVERTDDSSDTIETLRWLESWFGRDKHSTLDRRPGPVSMWGTPSNEDYQRHLVQGLPGVGTELADRIVRTLGVPFQWRVTKEELTLVDGIGKKKAERIWEALEDGRRGAE